MPMIVLFSFGVILAQEDARNADSGQPYNEGNKLARAEKYKEAIAEYKKAVAADANFAKPNYMMGYCYRKLNDFKNAEIQYKEAIKKDSKFETAYVALANLQRDSDRITDATNTFEATLVINPESPKANYGLGKIYYDQKKFSDALPYLEQATKGDAKYSLAFNVKGLTLKELRRYDEAENAMQKAIDAEKRRASKGNYYYDLGEILMLAKKYNPAVDALNNAIKMSKSRSRKAGANFNLGKIYQALGQKQKALKYYREAAKNNSWKQAAEYEIDIILNPDKYVN